MDEYDTEEEDDNNSGEPSAKRVKKARLTFNEVVLQCTFDFKEAVLAIGEREEVIKAYSNWECLFVLTLHM